MMMILQVLIVKMSKDNKKSDKEYGQVAFNECERKDSVDLLAFYYWERYQALMKHGFTDFQALELLKIRGLAV